MKELTFENYATELVDDYIALNYKGNHYEPIIKFTEILLNRLKEQSLNSKDQVIKDILGR
jgi:hypothetical protein